MKPKETFDCIVVTEVKLQLFEGQSVGHVKGLAEIVLNDQMIIRGIRINMGENGLFISYPIDPFFKGENLRSIASPITRNLREHIEAVILEKYNEQTKKN